MPAAKHWSLNPKIRTPAALKFRQDLRRMKCGYANLSAVEGNDGVTDSLCALHPFLFPFSLCASEQNVSTHFDRGQRGANVLTVRPPC